MSTRNYKCPDVVMLVVLNSVAESFLANMAELSTIRLNWNEDYATDLKTRIADAVTSYLGLDPKRVLRIATTEVHAIQEPAMRDIAFLKLQIEVDFEANKPLLTEMLKTLGFTQYLSKIQKGNHEALVAFLQMFSKNLTDDISKSIVDEGTDPQLLSRIKGYAEPFTKAEMYQESLKTSSKELPAETIGKLNDLYKEGIGICKIAAKYYKRNPVKKEQFTFDAVKRKVNVQLKKASAETPVQETKAA